LGRAFTPATPAPTPLLAGLALFLTMPKPLTLNQGASFLAKRWRSQTFFKEKNYNKLPNPTQTTCQGLLVQKNGYFVKKCYGSKFWKGWFLYGHGFTTSTAKYGV